jgi:hypothetical protein
VTPAPSASPTPTSRSPRASSQFFPRRGQLLELTADAHLKALGDSFDYFAGKIAWNQYLGLTPRQVLAFREIISVVAGDTPFYALPRLGQGSDIRGFRAGEYQDNILLAARITAAKANHVNARADVASASKE